jgi:hypothetical protein
MRLGDDSLGAGRERSALLLCCVVNIGGLSPASESQPFAPCRGKRPLGFVQRCAEPMRNRGRGATIAPVMVHINGSSVGALLLRKMRPMARSSPTRHNRRGCPCWRGRREPEHTGVPEHNCRPGFAFFNSPACAALRASSIAVARAAASEDRLARRRWGPWAWVKLYKVVSGHGALCLL